MYILHAQYDLIILVLEMRFCTVSNTPGACRDTCHKCIYCGISCHVICGNESTEGGGVVCHCCSTLLMLLTTLMQFLPPDNAVTTPTQVSIPSNTSTEPNASTGMHDTTIAYQPFSLTRQ